MFIAVMKYAFLCFADLFMGLFNYFFAPFIVLFSKANDKGEYWLPEWLSWFQTPDNSLNGDGGWRELHMPYKQERNKFERWVNQFRWLHRNACYGFNISVLGCPIKEGYKLEVTGDTRVSNRPLFEGLVIRVLKNADGSVFFQFYYVKRWSDTRCIRINLGWKLWGELKVGENRQFVFSPNPLMGYSVT